MNKFLTFDLGTTLYKVALFDDTGGMLALERVTPPIARLAGERWELRGDEFQQALVEGVSKLKVAAGNDWADIAAVSFATQANSFTLLDEDGRPLMPFVLWPDRRAAGLETELGRDGSLKDVRAITGVPRIGPLMTFPKLLWIKQNNPEIWQRARHVLWLSDYLTHWLTGQFATEAGVAGLSGLMDIRNLDWWQTAIAKVGLPAACFPRICRAGTDLGTLLPEAAAALELPRSCRFIVGCLDQYAGAIGTGAILPGQICETTGTVLAAVRCSNRFEPNVSPEVFQGPAFDPGLFFQMSFSSTSANLLEWYRNHRAPSLSFEELSRLAGEAPESQLIVDRYQEGASIEACFKNVTSEHTPGQVTRATMQCVADALRDQVRALAGGSSPAEMRSAGGAARSDVWLQIKANTLQIPMVALACPEPTSMGAAMLAARSIGLGSLDSLARIWIRPVLRVVPKPLE